jgi:hypothetical protein
MTKTSAAIAIGVLLGFLAAGPSVAQGPPDTPKDTQNAAPAQPPLDPKACASDKRATLGGGDTVEVPRPDKSLSEKLAATDGVICPPPEIDPDIHLPSRGGGAMPVLPPPGSPGGDPSVRPK